MLYVVRHGQSSFNYNRLICGITDVPLTALGEAQAAKTAGVLAGVRIDAVFTSTLLRARQTADIILSELGCEITPVTDARLVERSAGFSEGDQKQDESTYPAWSAQFDSEANGYETRESLAERVKDFLLQHKQLINGKNVLVVAHNGVIRAIRYLLGQVSLEEDWLGFGAKNGEVVVFDAPFGL